MDPLTMLMTAGGALGGGLVKAGGSRVIGAAAGAVGANLASRGSAADAVRSMGKNNNDIDWIETTYDGKTYEFANTPHVHQIMIDNGPLHMKETVDELVEVGLMRLIEDDSSPYTKDLPSGNTIGVGDFR